MPSFRAMAGPPRPVPRERLVNRNFVLLWQGQFVSQLGNQANAVAMMFWIKHATGSASLMGLLSMASALPGVLLGPFGGALADRYSRRAILIWSDLLSAALVLVPTLLLFLHPGGTRFIIVGLFVASAGLGILSAFFSPAASAILPDIVPPSRLQSANSLRQGSGQFSVLLGQGIGGVLFRLLGAPVLLLVDALSFLFAGASTAFLRVRPPSARSAHGWRDLFRTFVADTRIGLRYIWARKGLRNLLFMGTFLNFFLTPVGVLLPFYVEDHLHATPDWFGFLIAGLGAGALLGYVIAGAIPVRGKTRSIMVAALLVSTSVAIGSLGLVSHPRTALFVMMATGFVNGMVNIHIVTLMQLTTPSELRGRVFGLLGTVTGGLAPVAMGLTGVVADLADQNIPLIFVVCAGITAALSLLLCLDREFRAFLATETALPDAPSGPASPSPAGGGAAT